MLSGGRRSSGSENNDILEHNLDPVAPGQDTSAGKSLPEFLYRSFVFEKDGSEFY